MFDLYVPKRTRHRQSLPPCFSWRTSNMINKLKTQKRLWENHWFSWRIQSCVPKKLLASGNKDRIVKHLKSLIKSACLPKDLMNYTKQSLLRCEQVNMLNDFVHSVFSPKTSFTLKDSKVQKASLTFFDISKNTIRNIIDDIDGAKSRGPCGIAPSFYVKTSRNLCNIIYSVLRNIKRLRKIPNSSKVAAITPIFKKGDRKKFESYRSVSLLNIDSKVLWKCVYIALHNHFRKFLTKSQHGFVRRSVYTNILLFLSEYMKLLITTLTQR